MLSQTIEVSRPYDDPLAYLGRGPGGPLGSIGCQGNLPSVITTLVKGEHQRQGRDDHKGLTGDQ